MHARAASRDDRTIRLLGAFEFKDSFVMKYPKSREYLAYFYLVGDT